MSTMYHYTWFSCGGSYHCVHSFKLGFPWNSICIAALVVLTLLRLNTNILLSLSAI